MTSKPYGMICPIARACDVLEPRWTIPILVGLWSGATKFNDLRREIGRISPTLLSKRLKELEELGLIERIEDKGTGAVDYIRTPASVALEPALDALAKWAQTNLDAEFALCTTDAPALMWNLRRKVDTAALPKRRCVVQFRFSKEVEKEAYWLVVRPDAPVELCTSIPGFDIDLFVETSIMSLQGVAFGRTTYAREIELGELFLSGDALLARTIDRWLPPGDYAKYDDIPQLPINRRGGTVVRSQT